MAETDTITLLRDGIEALPAMLLAVAAATREVVMEMYWFDSSPIGRKFAEALAAKARDGVQVYVSYDAIGSLGVDTAMFAPLVEAGGRVIEFNPIAPWRTRFQLHKISQRDHRKIIVVDGKVGFIGGLNVGGPWMSKADGGAGWRDDVARVEGPCAARLRDLFFVTWRRQGGAMPEEALLTVRPRWEIARAVRRGLAPPPPVDPGQVAVIGHDAWARRWAIRRAYLTHIRDARRLVLLEHAYFLPDAVVRRALERAARRGAEVRVIVPRMSDVPSVTYACRAMFAGLMRKGVHVHEWVPGVLHAKTGLVDDWATTGSYNLDYLSLRHNLEANVASTAPDFVAAVEASLRRDLAEGCEEVDPKTWAQRPFGEKAMEWAFFLVRTLL